MRMFTYPQNDKAATTAATSHISKYQHTTFTNINTLKAYQHQKSVKLTQQKHHQRPSIPARCQARDLFPNQGFDGQHCCHRQVGTVQFFDGFRVDVLPQEQPEKAQRGFTKLRSGCGAMCFPEVMVSLKKKRCSQQLATGVHSVLLFSSKGILVSFQHAMMRSYCQICHQHPSHKIWNRGVLTHNLHCGFQSVSFDDSNGLAHLGTSSLTRLRAAVFTLSQAFTDGNIIFGLR